MTNRIYSQIAVLLFIQTLCLGADGLTLTTAEDGSTVAYNAAGVKVWQRYNPEAGPAGAVIERVTTQPSSATAPTWDPLTVLNPSLFSGFVGPVFDSQGNAWVVISDTVNLMAVQSNGTSGTWKAPHIIGPAPPASTLTVGLAVDRTGGFYVTYNADSTYSIPNRLMFVTYSTSAGWKAPVVAFTSPSFFAETIPAIDSVGRLVIVSNADGISSIVCNPDTSSCGAVQNVVPISQSPILPSLAANKSGSRLALVYLQYRQGLRYGFFNQTTAQWDTLIPVPDSEKATFSSYVAQNFIPTVVDDAGNVTLVSAMNVTLNTYTISGFRYEAGQWTTKRLLQPSRSSPDPATFGSIALNPSGGVLVSVPVYVGGETGRTVAIVVFRYTPGRGWNTETAATYDSGSATRCKIAWFVTGEAVAVYLDFNALIEKAALYANGVWSSGPPIPGGYAAFSPGLATAPTGEILLGMSSNTAPPSLGTVVTFLRP